MIRILNVQGENESRKNSNYKILNKLNYDLVSVDIDYSKDISLTCLDLLQIAIMTNCKLIVAHSIGAIIGKRLAQSLNIPCVLTNPCLGLNTLVYNLFSEKSIEIIERWMKETDFLLDFSRDSIIIGDDDEVIDHYGVTLFQATTAIFYHVEGGQHKLNPKQYDKLLLTATKEILTNEEISKGKF